MRVRRTWAVAAALLAVSGAANAHAHAPQLGIADDLSFFDPRPTPRRLAFEEARRSGARVVRLTLDWSSVAPEGSTKPAGFDAVDPDSPLYRWGYIEEGVREAARQRLKVILTVVRAPRWAEGPGRPAGAPPGTWKPDPEELAAFVRAAARRFSGFSPDPNERGEGLLTPLPSLPEVRRWQIWDEPNGGQTLQPPDPDHYREMLAASAGALRAVSDDNIVVAGGTAARGVISPAAFWRRLLCLTRSLRRAPCTVRARFDVYAHHPVSGRGPVGHAALTRLALLAEQARRLHTTRGRHKKPFWLTKLGWDTPPIARSGVSQGRQARNLAASLEEVARLPEVSLVISSGLQDRRTWIPEHFPTVAAGLFLPSGQGIRGAEPKPALGAFRFPFVVRVSGRGALAWGMAPIPLQRVVIEQRTRGGWRMVAATRADGTREFRAPLQSSLAVYRARQGRIVSPAWRPE
jgi:hypothetical protein